MPPTKKPPTKKPLAQKPAAKKPAARKPAAEKPAAETPAAKKPAAETPAARQQRRRETKPRPPSARHRRAVAAVQELFRLCPLEAGNWIYRATGKDDSPCDLVEARWIEPAPRGPAYVVPSPAAEERPPTTEEVMARVLTRSIEQEAAASKVKVEVLGFDFEEAQRQTLAEGGSEVELLVRLNSAPRKPVDLLLGVMLPDEHEDGKEMMWAVLRKSTWQLIAYPQLLGPSGAKMPLIMSVPLYLWPGTGLEDPQENCSVRTGEPVLPGVLGNLLKLQDPKEKARDRARSRKWNLERQVRQRGLDQERRAAAARRLALTGDAGISEEKLAAMVPAIDVENDRINMIQTYNILRLWEQPLEALLTSLPPACLGLALFGWRDPSMSVTSALERCAFTLRRALRGAPAPEARRAALGLAVIGAAFLEPEEVTRLLGKMKLL